MPIISGSSVKPKWTLLYERHIHAVVAAERAHNAEIASEVVAGAKGLFVVVAAATHIHIHTKIAKITATSALQHTETHNLQLKDRRRTFVPIFNPNTENMLLVVNPNLCIRLGRPSGG